MSRSIARVDIDGTLCTNTDGRYEEAKPIQEWIDYVNWLHDACGVTIILWTARGATSGIDWTELTLKQMNEWGVKFDALDTSKPHYDFVIDDKSLNPLHVDLTPIGQPPGHWWLLRQQTAGKG